MAANRHPAPRVFSRIARVLLWYFAVMTVTALVIPIDGCAGPLRFAPRQYSVFKHALFIRGSGTAASLLDSTGRRIDFKNLLAGQPARPQRELQAAIDTINQSIESDEGVPLRHRLNYDYDAYLQGLTQEMKAQLSPGKKRRVLLWIHGGRNPLAGGAGRTLEILDSLKATDYYPICINWESGDLASVWAHLKYSRPAKIGWPTRLYRAAKVPFVLLFDVGRGVARVPLGVYGDFSRELTAVSTNRRLRTGSVDSVRFSRGSMRSGPGRFLHPVWWLVTLPTRTAFSLIIHSGGPGDWESLLHSTQGMFQTDGDLRATDEPLQFRDDSGALSMFLHRFHATIDSLNDNRPEEQRVDVTIICHSMGAIIATELLRHHRELPVSNIVYMAAACRVHDFFDVILPFLDKHPHTRFFNLMLHPVNDLRESFTPILGDAFYQGSLLTWIDDFLGTQESPLDRTLGRSENVMAATRLVEGNIRPRVMFKTFGDGSSADSTRWRFGTPTRHGDFSKPALHFWEEEFWTPAGGAAMASDGGEGSHHH